MRYSHHTEFCAGRWDCSVGHRVVEIMAWYVILNFLTASFVVLIFACSAELALPDAGCSLSITGRKCCTRRVDTGTLAAGHLQQEIISWVAWDSVVCISCKKPISCGIFLCLLSPLQKSKNIWHLKIGYILNHCKRHLFSKKQLVEKNNLGLKPCMKLPFKISGIGFVIFIFLEVWRRAVWWQLKENRYVELECACYRYAEKSCLEDLLKLWDQESQWHWEEPMCYFKLVRAGDWSEVPAHHQKVVSRENVYIPCHRQIRPNFPIGHSSLVNGMASSPIQTPSRLVVRSESVA